MLGGVLFVVNYPVVNHLVVNYPVVNRAMVNCKEGTATTSEYAFEYAFDGVSWRSLTAPKRVSDRNSAKLCKDLQICFWHRSPGAEVLARKPWHGKLSSPDVLQSAPYC